METNYRQGGEAAHKAWLAYSKVLNEPEKEFNIHFEGEHKGNKFTAWFYDSKPSMVSFVAGYNAGKQVAELEKIKMNLTHREHKLLNMLEERGYDISYASIKRIIRDNEPEKEFNIHFEGEHKGNKFTAWLLLSCIRELTPWTCSELACMTDYPSMAREGDWSGVRDTEEERLWEIFQKFVVKPYLKPVYCQWCGHELDKDLICQQKDCGE